MAGASPVEGGRVGAAAVGRPRPRHPVRPRVDPGRLSRHRSRHRGAAHPGPGHRPPAGTRPRRRHDRRRRRRPARGPAEGLGRHGGPALSSRVRVLLHGLRDPGRHGHPPRRPGPRLAGGRVHRRRHVPDVPDGAGHRRSGGHPGHGADSGEPRLPDHAAAAGGPPRPPVRQRVPLPHRPPGAGRREEHPAATAGRRLPRGRSRAGGAGPRRPRPPCHHRRRGPRRAGRDPRPPGPGRHRRPGDPARRPARRRGLVGRRSLRGVGGRDRPAPARRVRGRAVPAALAGLIPLSPSSTKRDSVMTATREIGVGLISVGWMGKLHTRAYQAMPSVYPELGLKCRLVIAADTAPDRIAYAKDVLGYERGTTDYREALADPAVAVVSIGAPNMLPSEMGMAAAKAAKPFWIEKPVGRDAHETAEVAAAAREAGVATSIGYNYRHAPAIEHMRKLIADGTLGRITNIRSVFLNGYAAEPKGALSWRFQKEFSGSGAMGDLLSHVADLVQYVVGPIEEVTALSSIIHAERPILPMGSGTHFAVIEDGEMGTVENEDYGAVLARFAPNSRGPGAVGPLECSRVVVGPQCGLSIEVYGTEGSATWNFERMNELKLALGRGGAHAGYTTILGNPGMGDYGKFQPGPGNSMGYDDLKVVEAKKFLQSVTHGAPGACTMFDAQSAADLVSASVATAASGPWVKVPSVQGATYGGEPAGAGAGQ